MHHSKSVGKMREVSRTQRRVVLFASHITAAIDAAKDVYASGRLPDPAFQGYLVPDVQWQTSAASRIVKSGNSQTVNPSVRWRLLQTGTFRTRVSGPRNNCLILGAGRSGTSLTGLLLERAGYHVYTNSYPRDSGNPLGYFEDLEVIQVNDAILAPFYCSKWRRLLRTVSRKPNIVGTGAWLLDLDPSRLNSVNLRPEHVDKFRELFARNPFAYKDPRFSFTIGALAPIIPKNTVYLCVFRHPLQVVESTKKHAFRGGVIVDDEYCFGLWEAHYGCLFRHYQEIGGQWLFVSYEQLMNGKAFSRIEEFLGVQLDKGLAKRELMRTHTVGRLSGRVAEIYDRLKRLEETCFSVKLAPEENVLFGSSTS
jgi:hypothetical protein